MPNQVPLNPLILVKFVLWIAVIVGATILLRRRRVTSGVRLAFLVAGVLIFGFLFGILIPQGLNPNPVASLRTLLRSALVRRQLAAPIAVMLLILLATVFVSNKSICGWGCQLGLLQDLLHRVGLPKWRPPFWLSNTVRVGAFGALVAGLLVAGLDWIGVIDPFQIFSLNFTLGIVLFTLAVLVASLFVYRPWCHFLCPFGLLGWLVEQVSVFRPRINREACKACKICVRACPGQAMADIYDGKAVHADCFACGACIEACPRDEALGWWSKSEAGER
ncbi:MAG TPA: 4Fe-4S binding protein [Chloroflexi bacterium]|nr:4Fe-4S binding protein [Chloroflexota bacterium]